MDNQDFKSMNSSGTDGDINHTRENCKIQEWLILTLFCNLVLISTTNCVKRVITLNE